MISISRKQKRALALVLAGIITLGALLPQVVRAYSLTEVDYNTEYTAPSWMVNPSQYRVEKTGLAFNWTAYNKNPNAGHLPAQIYLNGITFMTHGDWVYLGPDPENGKQHFKSASGELDANGSIGYLTWDESKIGALMPLDISKVQLFFMALRMMLSTCLTSIIKAKMYNRMLLVRS